LRGRGKSEWSDIPDIPRVRRKYPPLTPPRRWVCGNSENSFFFSSCHGEQLRVYLRTVDATSGSLPLLLERIRCFPTAPESGDRRAWSPSATPANAVPGGSGFPLPDPPVFSPGLARLSARFLQPVGQAQMWTVLVFGRGHAAREWTPQQSGFSFPAAPRQAHKRSEAREADDRRDQAHRALAADETCNGARPRPPLLAAGSHFDTLPSDRDNA